MNRAFCGSCGKLAPARRDERDGKIYLVKECPDCGPNETLISSDAARANAKRALDVDFEYHDCVTNCPDCTRHKHPRFAFVNVTNRCNVNCPICFDNVPGLEFEFEPPIEYFEKIFEDLARSPHRATVCLFGGEPTVRDDMFDILALARSHGLGIRVFTNGVTMADPDYCRKVLESHAHILLSYDGVNPETYRQLRGSDRFLDKKLQAIDNIGSMKHLLHGKVTIVSVFAKGLNDRELPELLDFCHERRDFIGTVYLMPLVHAWDPADWEYDPERITTEDVERMVDDLFPAYALEFVPLGFVHQLTAAAASIGREALPYGAHLNCESVYYLVSDGEKYLPVAHYLKGTTTEFARAFLDFEKRLAARGGRWDRSLVGRALGGVRLRKPAQRLLGLAAMFFFMRRWVRTGRLLRGRGLGKLGHGLALTFELPFRRKSRAVLARHTNMQGHLKLVVLPLEDNHVLETERLERCPTMQAYYDPERDRVGYVPLCAWKLHNKMLLQHISNHYATEGAAVAPQDTAAGA